MSTTGQDRQLVRLGNPWLSYSFFAFWMIAMAALLAVTVSAIASGGPKDTGLRFGTLLSAVPAAVFSAALLLIAIIVVVRNPRIISRVLVLTSTEVRMPRRKQGRIPLDDVAGVGLALQQGAYGRGGIWGLMVWRSDGTYSWAGGLQRKAEFDKPEQTRVAEAARQVYGYVIEHQGPDGLLAQRALQRHPHFSHYSAFTKFWDPASS